MVIVLACVSADGQDVVHVQQEIAATVRVVRVVHARPHAALRVVLDPALGGEGGGQVLVPAPRGFAQTIEVDVQLQYLVIWDPLHALWYT